MGEKHCGMHFIIVLIVLIQLFIYLNMCQLKIVCHSKHPVKLLLHLHIFKKKKKKKKNSMQAVCFPRFCLSCIIHPQIHASCLVCTCHKTYALHRSPVYLRANTKRQPFTLMSTPSANLESSLNPCMSLESSKCAKEKSQKSTLAMINQTFFLSVPDILELIFNYKKRLFNQNIGRARL